MNDTSAPRESLAGAMIARQAIMNGEQAVVGYELLDRSHMAARTTRRQATCW